MRAFAARHPAGVSTLLLPLLMGAVLGGWAGPLSAATAGGDQPRSGENRALALEREIERLAAANARMGALWPGFDPLDIPLAVYDGKRTFLFRHPAPPRGFIPVKGSSVPAYSRNGRHEAVTANNSAGIGGVITATLLLEDAQPRRSAEDLAAVAIRKAFHVYQRAHHPGWQGDEGVLFTYPTDAANLLALRRLETEALREALTADEEAAAACWARGALALRRERYAGMDAAFAAYERGTELNEGLAAYVEERTAGGRTVELPPAEFGPAEVRRRAHATGQAIALLLDRFMPGWQAKFETDDRRTLDEALAAALGAGNSCTFSEAVQAGASRRARADVAALTVERARRVSAFEGKPGWRVVVIDPEGGEPLWPQVFDPGNVERVGAKSVLHTGFLRLGNGAGRLKMLNAEALTEGTGPHPLFQGIRHVLVTGLAEPEVSETDGQVRVEAPGLTVEFKGASVTRSGQTVTVRLGA